MNDGRGVGSMGNKRGMSENWGGNCLLMVGRVAWVDIGMLSDGRDVDLGRNGPVSSGESRLWNVRGRAVSQWSRV